MKKIISLLSEGFDSPIATYLMIKQGFLPVCVTFITNNENIDKFKSKIIKIVKILSSFIQKVKIKIFFIDHTNNLTFLKENCERKLTCILCKRFMIRIAKKIGELEGTNLILTGDILGEQASQTLDNLYTYQQIAENATIIRPLIGFNKLDVLNISRKIGLYEVCSEKSDFCTNFPEFPETHAKVPIIEESEKNIPILSLIDQSIKEAEIIEI